MSSLTIYKSVNPDLITYNPFPLTDLPENAMGEDLGEYPTLKDAIETGLRELASLGENFPISIELVDEQQTPENYVVLGNGYKWKVNNLATEFQTLMRLRDGEYYAKQFLRDVPSIAQFAKRSTKVVNYI
ncbi:MAG: hypothetical protein VW829_14125 [Deltaproteobacteria bacterium]|jgi:hypothetical protein